MRRVVFIGAVVISSVLAWSALAAESPAAATALLKVKVVDQNKKAG